MFFRKKKNKKILDIEQIPMEQPFGLNQEKNEEYPEQKKEETVPEVIKEELTEETQELEKEADTQEMQNPEDEADTQEAQASEEEADTQEVQASEEEADTQEVQDPEEETDAEEAQDSEEEMNPQEAEDFEEDPEAKGKKRAPAKKKLGKKKAALLLAALLLIAGGVYIYFYGVPGMNSGTKIYVEKVSELINLGSGNGMQNRYAGVVESQDTWNIKQNADKTVKEIYVKEGDSVKIGDKLFAYDNDEAVLNLEQAKLELERMKNEIKAGEAEIQNLEKEKKSASSSDQLEYTIQIQSQKATNKKTEYEIKSQEAKIKSLTKATQNSVVKSEMEGVVKKINQSVMGGGDSVSIDSGDDSGDDAIFMSILATGDYRIKAKVNEQNKYQIEEGKEVIVRSRVDDEVSWKGTITKLDTQNPENNSSSDYGMESDDTSTSSKYPFYVKLESSEGLVLGQHVYIEPDQGQDKEKEGIWLDSYYIVQEEKGSFVWKENAAKRLEKASIELGEYNEELDQYQVKSGLTAEDYIAFPQDNLEEGMRTTRNIEEASEASENDTGVEPETDYDYEGSTGDIILEDEGVLEDTNTFEGEMTGEDQIWEDEPTNDDGSVGLLDGQTEVLA